MFTSAIDGKRFETLIEINALINSHFTDGKQLLHHILESATRLTNGEASSLILENPENQKLYFEVTFGEKATEIQRFSLKKGEGIAGWVAENNRSLIVNDAEADSRFSSFIGKKIGFQTQSILAVPMRLKDHCVGVIEIINKKDGKVFTNEDLQWLEIFANQSAMVIQNARIYEKLLGQVSELRSAVPSSVQEVIYRSKNMESLLTVIKKVAATNSCVLVLGESGVGKELVAEQVHRFSPRNENSFIKLNCAAIPESLLESELFGHIKGAFTDASSDRRGRFELADGGTIFLDEIGDMNIALQAKLLRIIENGTYEPVGSSETRHVDVRIIAATNKNLEDEIAKGLFRQDLFFRLNVLPVVVPPLRERKDDIPVLAEYFLKKHTKQSKKKVSGISTEAMQSLLLYSWPGNVRELQNVIERAVVITNSGNIEARDLFIGGPGNGSDNQYEGYELKDAINIFKRQYVLKTLESNGWRKTETAKKLGIQRTYLSRLLKELGIEE